MRSPLLLLAAVAVSSVACKEKTAPVPAGSASAALPVPSEAATPARPAQPPPKDLDLETAQRELGCGGKKGPQACRILEEFGSATHWKADMPSGEGRWIGHAYVVTKGVEKQEILLFRARIVPTAQVGPTDLPLMVGTGGLPEDRTEHAEKLIRALQEGGSGRTTNLARLYLADFKPKEELGAVATKGKSVQLISAEDTYIRREGVKKLLIVKLASAIDAEHGDGVYAEVWSAFW